MNTISDLEKKINSELTTKINKSSIRHGQIYLSINDDCLIDVILFLKTNSETKFQQLIDITAVDYPENDKRLKVVYLLISHENNQFEEPLFAFVPSIGISALNVCPAVLKKFYKKPCLLALSLYGNSQRPGRSLVIYLLNKNMDKIHSVEKIFLRDDLKLRHFVTNQKNELYEDKNGDIYVSADKKGIYKISFIDFRN